MTKNIHTYKKVTTIQVVIQYEGEMNQSNNQSNNHKIRDDSKNLDLK